MPRLCLYRVHALQRMLEWGIDFHEIHQVLDTGQLVESYPEDVPYPSRLVCGRVGDRAIHVVAADHDGETIIITTYVPSPAQWDENFTRRRTV